MKLYFIRYSFSDPMNQKIRTVVFALLLLFLTSCSHIFEVDSDVQARQALFDLMKIQDQFYQENKRYAGQLFEIEKYNFKYHTGIVYMEIERANKDGYRAISLPAESTTARVFAFDTELGGFYEMDEIEVSKYVLGALRAIRDQRQKDELNDITGWVLMAGMVFIGLRFFSRYKSKENNLLMAAYFFCLFPLGWAFAVLGKMEKNVVFSSTISQLSWAALLLAAVALGLGCKWAFQKKAELTQPSLLSLVGCTLLISLMSAGVMIHTLWTYQT